VRLEQNQAWKIGKLLPAAALDIGRVEESKASDNVTSRE